MGRENMKILAEFTEDMSVKMHLVKNGITEVKKISYQEFQNMILDATVEKKVKGEWHVGKTPHYYYDCILMDEEKKQFSVLLYIPGQKRPLRFTKGKKNYFVPYPDLLMKIDAEKGKMHGLKCFAVKGASITPRTILYRFPFSNVSRDTGYVCMGGNSNITVECMKDADNVTELFFSSQYNGDYYTNSSSTYANVDMEELLLQLEKKEVFPDEILIPTELTFKEL